MEEPGVDGIEALVLNCNKLAMDHLRVERFDEAFSLLRKAEEMLGYPDETPGKLRLLAITLNNLGCFYKRSAKPNVALKYLQQALDIEVKTSNDRTNVAGTHLNICAIKSQLGKHESALQHAKQALFLLTSPGFEYTPNSVTTLAIAYHNSGVEYEFLMEAAEASKAYLSGWELAKQHLGTSHPLTSSLEKSYRNLSEVKFGKVKGNLKPDTQAKPHQPPNRIDRRRTSSKATRSPRIEDTVLPLIRRNTTSSKKRKASVEAEVTTPVRKSLGVRSSSPSGGSTTLTPQSSTREGKTKTKMSTTPTEFVRPPLRTPNSERNKITRNPMIPKPPVKPNTYPIRRKEALESIRTSNNPTSEQSAKPHIRETPTRAGPRTVLNIVTGSKKRAAAVRIQKHWRGYRTRKQFQGLKTGRKLISRKEAERLAHEAIHELEQLKKQVKEDSQIPISAAVTRESKPGKRPLKNKANRLAPIPEAKAESKLAKLVVIQAHVKGFLARRRFQKAKQAIIMIQKQVRRHQVRRLFLSIRDAIVFIQTMWRDHCHRKA